MTENWRIDELSHAGNEHLDESYVSGYDRKSQYDPIEDIKRFEELGLSRTSNVIDFGSGTGTFALTVAPYCRSVIAVDPSPAMNAALEERAQKADIKNLGVSKNGFLSYNHSSIRVDFIFTRNALHHLPDFWKVQALLKMHSVLVPKGIVRIKDIIFDFKPGQTHNKIEEWISGAVDDPSLGWTNDELAQHVREEYSTFAWILEVMLEQTGFEILDREYRRNAYGTYTCRTVS